MELSKTLKEIRKTNKFTIQEVSKRSGICKSTISVWERGEIIPTVNNFERLLNALGYELKIVKTAKVGE